MKWLQRMTERQRAAREEHMRGLSEATAKPKSTGPHLHFEANDVGPHWHWEEPMTWTREMAVELARKEYERGRAEMAEQIAQAIERVAAARKAIPPGLVVSYGDGLDDAAMIARAQMPPKPTGNDPDPTGLLAG